MSRWRPLCSGTMTAEEIQAQAQLLRSPMVLQSIGDYLAGQRFGLGLIHADASIFSSPLPQPTLEAAAWACHQSNSP